MWKPCKNPIPEWVPKPRKPHLGVQECFGRAAWCWQRCQAHELGQSESKELRAFTGCDRDQPPSFPCCSCWPNPEMKRSDPFFAHTGWRQRGAERVSPTGSQSSGRAQRGLCAVEAKSRARGKKKPAFALSRPIRLGRKQRVFSSAGADCREDYRTSCGA